MNINNGKDLQSARTRAGITQAEVAEYLGYNSKGKPNASMIARFEGDYAKINPRVAKLLDLYFQELQQPVA